MPDKRKIGRKRKAPSWQRKELKDIQRYWKPEWNSKEGKRKTMMKRT
jgi:hypothetical protein